MDSESKDRPDLRGRQVTQAFLAPQVPLEVTVQMALQVLQAPPELVDPKVRQSLASMVAMVGIASSLALLDHQVRAEVLDPSLRDLLDQLEEKLSSLGLLVVP